ncbi:putative lysyl-tRNA synthetase (lysine--tRNA ligase) [Metarhizium acridum CQMa 102]|uniref:Lysyl-tRNA synthetase n=1 Tax=Metarhizium acridum (strain CQMa 102) TaxID=655827 RepID=E9E8L4_METAQ|nr:putative lysyl-tRNA synthetase (lysine--tRNA ligase) [Metarhizium acridum CQMa 102]EFY87743.1 putative lysyl-tRNA synthetase (lysine--tRNA ligase) [Metarhizium acridum CQMa 102]
MRPSACLRLARRSSVISQRCSATSISPSIRISSSLSLETTHFRAGARGFFSESVKKASRFTGAQDSSESLSPFKQHRRDELREDQQSDDPLYANPYPRLESSATRKSAPEFLEDFDEQAPSEEVTLSGRVRSKRVVGKSLIFLDIVNEFQKVQIMVNKNKCVSEKHGRIQKFSLFKHLIQVGDHISVTGNATRTKAGEPTLQAIQLPELLSPSMEQIPEKLNDPKTRMADRHVDMLVNREVVDVLRLRAEITKYMRDHFHSKRFLEFQTPILAENAGGAVARPFVTQATEFRKKDLALRIAPELWLKRLVVGGVDRVFEIGPAFRNEGVDATHNPEFTMCEFYSAYTNLADLIKETEELLHGLAKHTQELISTQLTTLPPIDLSRFVRPFRQIEFIPGLEEALGIRFPKLSSDDALPEVLAVLKLAGITVPGEVPNSLPKLLDRLAAVYLEPMSFHEPIFITNHPVCMSPLAKGFLCPKTYQLVSARAELFVGGRELANMYEEENDPEEQKRKLAFHRTLVNKPNGEVGFEEAAGEREPTLAEEAEMDEWEGSPLDQSYVKALDFGLPPTGGWGCGVERLVMLFSGANRISDCLSFGTLRNVVGLSSDEKATDRSV